MYYKVKDEFGDLLAHDYFEIIEKLPAPSTWGPYQEWYIDDMYKVVGFNSGFS